MIVLVSLPSRRKRLLQVHDRLRLHSVDSAEVSRRQQTAERQPCCCRSTGGSIKSQ
jgi:hypothetical protein